MAAQEDRYFPPIDEKNFKTIMMIYEADPGYFDDRKCPYSQDFINVFRGRAKFQDFDSHASKDLPSSDDLVVEINQLAGQLKSYWNDIKGGEATPADKNTYFRIASGLLEKMIDMKERVLKVKEYEAFTLAILDILDRELDVDQRNRIMDRLKTQLGTPLTEAPAAGITSNTTQEEQGKSNVNDLSIESLTL